jgi:hypothetical protein
VLRVRLARGAAQTAAQQGSTFMSDQPVHTHSSFKEARAQAAEYLGFVAGETITVGTRIFEIPNPSLLDEPQQDAVDALDVDMDENWDRHPDVTDDKGNVQRGPLKVPHRKDGQPVNYNRELAKALFGDQYDAFIADGGRPNDVALIWSRMNREMSERRAKDTKSGGSDSGVEAVPDAD